MRITLLRHGEMDGDPFVRPDRPVSGCLSQDGIRQATAAAAALASRRWHTVFSSPFGRALQTAEIVCGPSTPITVVDALHEWMPNPDLRDAPSTVWEDMQRRDAQRSAEELWQTDAGEGTYAFYGRVVPGTLAALTSIGCRPAHGGFVLAPALAAADVLVVAHGGSLGVLLAHLLGVRPFPLNAFSFALCGIAEVDLVERTGVWYPQLSLPAPAGRP